MKRRLLLWPILLLIATEAVVIWGKNLPSYVKVCKKSDPKFNECLVKSIALVLDRFAKGHKPLGIGQLEPFYVEKMDFGDPGQGSISLRQIYHNVSIHGMTRSKLDNMDANFKDDNCYWRFSGLTPTLRMEANYNISGQVLIFPLNGHGKCNNTLTNLKARHQMRCERHVKDNKTYLRVTNYTLELTPDEVVYNFANLVEDPQISEEIHNTINENALVLFNDVKYGFQESFNVIYKSVINRVFSKIPENELFLD